MVKARFTHDEADALVECALKSLIEEYDYHLDCALSALAISSGTIGDERQYAKWKLDQGVMK